MILYSFLCLVLIGEVFSQSSSCCDSSGNAFGQFTGTVFQDNLGISFPVIVGYDANGVTETHMGGKCGNREPILPKSVGPGIFTWDRDLDYGLDVCVLTGTSTLTKSATTSATWDYFYINRDGTVNDSTLSGPLSFIPLCSGGCGDHSPSQAPPLSQKSPQSSNNNVPSQSPPSPSSFSNAFATTKGPFIGYVLLFLLGITLLY